jgi:hypothetical protein
MVGLTARRRRLGLQLPIRVSGNDERGAPFAEVTRTLNVSGGGVCFESRQRLAPGLRLTLYVSLPLPLRRRFGGRPVYRVQAVICRVERIEAQAVWRIGARFLGEVEA